MPEVSQFRRPTPGSWVNGPVRHFLSSDGRAARGAAADQRARALVRRLGIRPSWSRWTAE